MLDALRSSFPKLGFALYALEPGGLVTFEVMDEQGAVYTFTSATAQGAIDQAFPPALLEQEPDHPKPQPPPEAQEETHSVFS